MMLKDRIVVVTGAGRGLGRAFAEACATEGATVVVADINAAWGEETARALKALGKEAVFLPVDLGEPASIEAFAAALATRFVRIDGLVNNAALATGIGGKSFEEIDIETWDQIGRASCRERV